MGKAQRAHWPPRDLAPAHPVFTMPLTRLHNPGARYFFTVATFERRPLLVQHIDELRRAFRITRARHPFEVEAIVVLPDHLHTLWRPPASDNDPGKRWRVLKRLFSARVPPQSTTPSQQRHRENGVWQRRFWEHCIVDERDWIQHLEYIHYNPVKHGYCAMPRDWPHSSFGRVVELGWYDAEWNTDPARRGSVRG